MADEWPVLETRTEYECEWFTVGFDQVVRPDGERARYYWVEPSDAVTVVAVTDDELVTVEQYRPRQRETFRTCPVGGVDEGESFVEAGVRELAEETGYRAGTAELVATYHDAGWLRRRRGVVYAGDLRPGYQQLDDGEFIDVQPVPVGEAVEEAMRPPVAGWALTAVLLAEREGYL